MNGIEARFQLSYPGFALDVDLALPGRGVTALFGVSGSGKTSCLRLVAGLARAPIGYLAVNGEVWQDTERGIFVPPHRRSIGYVFQEASLFSHLDVRGNLAFGLRRVPVSQQRVPLDEAVALLGIGHLLDRRVESLSGGERQRVAIARALALSPSLLLMDEPLAALDSARKQEILPYLEAVQTALAIPMLYVSHAADEVARLADYLVLLDAGQVQAQGEAVALMTRLDLPLALDEAASAVLLATIVEHDPDYQLTYACIAGGKLSLPLHAGVIGQTVRIRIAARDVSLALSQPTDSSILNILPITVQNISAPNGAQLTIGLDLGGQRLLARITCKSADMLGIRPGRELYAQIKGVAVLG